VLPRKSQMPAAGDEMIDADGPEARGVHATSL
jgi:hypothetical protein